MQPRHEAVDGFARAGQEHVDALRREQDRAFQAGRFAALAHGRAQGLDVVQRDELVSGNIDDLHEGRRLHGRARKGVGGLR
ncbi:hypothetical protein D3C81_2031070 [compost metagenome]